MCLFVCRRSRCERGRTRRRAVPQASERGLVLRPWTRRTVPRSGLPGRLCERQVQSHPLVHIWSQFYKHNLPAYFTKLHMFLLLKHGWIATPWLVIIIPWPPRLTSICDYSLWMLIAAKAPLRTRYSFYYTQNGYNMLYKRGICVSVEKREVGI